MKLRVLAACSALAASCWMSGAQAANGAASGGSASKEDVTTPVASPAAHDFSSTYVIGPADMLAVNVWKEPTLSGNSLVRPDGMISMALLGDIKAAGMTPLQLSGEISDRLKKYVQSPVVSVVVTEIRSKNVNMLGEVTRKGPVALSSGMTLLDAIGAAGGLTEFANEKKIYILRTVNGTRVRIPAHYKQALKGEPDANPVLQPGDTIVVP